MTAGKRTDAPVSGSSFLSSLIVITVCCFLQYLSLYQTQKMDKDVPLKHLQRAVEDDCEDDQPQLIIFNTEETSDGTSTGGQLARVWINVSIHGRSIMSSVWIIGICLQMAICRCGLLKCLWKSSFVVCKTRSFCAELSLQLDISFVQITSWLFHPVIDNPMQCRD